MPLEGIDFALPYPLGYQSIYSSRQTNRRLRQEGLATSSRRLDLRRAAGGAWDSLTSSLIPQMQLSRPHFLASFWQCIAICNGINVSRVGRNLIYRCIAKS